ncbi:MULTISPECIES: site-specific integrase [Lysinibacillus]|uniref:site-specific integrase n=1 Tax=Lysinibacillus TaxID=400634 RepID=UPI0009F380EC|nr:MULTISPECIES: site-specific integrase [Lysinibacillus]MDP1396230.1 site-specific integrase [Lysinibacillus capsici]MDP1416691.1 site-specific integrase [Lysinibacillus capsici]MDP1432575.1 site-specific integrase [Lysinibacillus capsici]
MKEFLSYVDKHHNIIYRTLIYAIAFTGMRPGEAVALKYEDVDLEKKVIHINKTVYAKKSIRGYFELTPPKTAGSIRSVDIDDIVVEKLKQLYKWREYREWAKSDFVFGDKEGIPPIVKMLNQTVRRIGALTDINKQFRTYILRHTHISLLAEAGVDLNFIMNRVGHKNSDQQRRFICMLHLGCAWPLLRGCMISLLSCWKCEDKNGDTNFLKSISTFKLLWFIYLY